MLKELLKRLNPNLLKDEEISTAEKLFKYTDRMSKTSTTEFEERLLLIHAYAWQGLFTMPIFREDRYLADMVERNRLQLEAEGFSVVDYEASVEIQWFSVSKKEL